jgi:hypothetical protein
MLSLVWSIIPQMANSRWLAYCLQSLIGNFGCVRRTNVIYSSAAIRIWMTL